MDSPYSLPKDFTFLYVDVRFEIFVRIKSNVIFCDDCKLARTTIIRHHLSIFLEINNILDHYIYIYIIDKY